MWHLSILLDPVSSYQGSVTINYSHVESKMRNDLGSLDDQLVTGLVTKEQNIQKKRDIQNMYSANRDSGSSGRRPSFNGVSGPCARWTMPFHRQTSVRLSEPQSEPLETIAKFLFESNPPTGQVDIKSAPGPVRASRTDRRSDRSRP
jgi:hypothetical protein